MNKFLRVLFILVILAMSGAIVFQLFFPTYMGSHSGYGISVGWQREIGIWNLQYHHSVNAVGAFENYLLVLGWIVGWWIENSSRKTV